MNNPKRIILAGGSGFIGTALSGEFIQRGYDVIVLTRSPRPRPDKAREVVWDAKNPGEWIQFLDGAEAVVNLAGKNINCPHTPENLRALMASRVDSVKAIARAVAQVKAPPQVWVQASAMGFYGNTHERVCDETAPNGLDPIATVCREWEAALAGEHLPETRQVVLRIGLVLGRAGGVLPILNRLTKAFLGGAAGNGRQYISWIHIADLVRMLVMAVEREELAGVFNSVGPDPVTNAEFMRELRRVWHRPWCPSAPRFMIKLGAKLTGSDASLSLNGQWCVPGRFLEAGFDFKYSTLRPALVDLCP